MKKLFVKISLTFIIIAAVVLIWLGLRSCDKGGTPPSYSFLAGREPITGEKANMSDEEIRYIYSFEADFNDLCSKADAELIPDGFVVRTLVIENLSGNKFPRRSYRLKNRFLNGPDRINISNGLAYIEKEDTIGPKDGWIVVEIIYWPGMLRLF